MRCVLLELGSLRAWSRRKLIFDGRRQDLKILRNDDGMRLCSRPRALHFSKKKKSRCEFWFGTMAVGLDDGWTSRRPLLSPEYTEGFRCEILPWVAHPPPGSCASSIFGKFSVSAHNLIPTGYYRLGCVDIGAIRALDCGLGVRELLECKMYVDGEPRCISFAARIFFGSISAHLVVKMGWTSRAVSQVIGISTFSPSLHLSLDPWRHASSCKHPVEIGSLDRGRR